MLRRTLLTFALAVVAAFAQPAQAQAVLAEGVLRDLAGRTLYVFARDVSGHSDCYDACALLWPAFTAQTGVEVLGEMTVHARRDGAMQWGWNGRPLYRFAGDVRPGDANGDGTGGVWRVVRAEGAPLASSSQDGRAAAQAR